MIPVALATAAMGLLEQMFKTINLHLEATPPEQRAALAARWNSFWAQVGDGILKPVGIILPPLPTIPAQQDEV